MSADSAPPICPAAEDHSDVSADVQANLGRMAKSWLPGADGDPGRYRTRDCSFFFFFRVVTRAEMAATRERLKDLHDQAGVTDRGGADSKSAGFSALRLDLNQPALINAGLVEQRKRETDEDPESPLLHVDAPAPLFADWMNVLVHADGTALLARAKELAEALGGSRAGGEEAVEMPARGDSADGETLMAQLAGRLGRDARRGLPQAASWLLNVIDKLEHDCLSVLTLLQSQVSAPAAGAWQSPLLRFILYELVRQAAPAFVPGKDLPALRSERDEEARLERPERFDRTPVSWAFSFAGLKGLKIDPVTLSSFPDAFKEGMAARARRLRDTGPSAPENWEGEFGLKSIHGYFTAGSSLGALSANEESFWRTLRADVDAFNGRAGRRGNWLRTWVGLMFRCIGLEIVHIEVGQDPYKVGDSGRVKPLDYRREHFGFRDGLSQPFVDLGLGDTLPGGGTPSRRGTWTPVAPGEVFLDFPDESGKIHEFPANKTLRRGSTFLVFRKLEQDVYGFRSFLRQQRPESAQARKKLGAQFVGRWKNGTPLVRSPEGPRAVGGEAEAALNDFRYAADDPFGDKCPLSAHIRRANPRDIGGRNDVRHHRILRRGISFGGPLLREKAPDDGARRGILFVAANARIDVQFEVVQADWINSGEFLGQAGLGRCPIAGRQEAGAAARFLEAGAAAPITGLPSFVTMRGGDYFFAPGLCALKAICAGCTFKPDGLLLGGHSMGDTTTPELFGLSRIAEYGNRFLQGGDRVIDVQVPNSPETITFVGRHADVKRVLSDETVTDPSDVRFSTYPYLAAGLQLSRGDSFLVGTDVAGPTSGKHGLLMMVLTLGWQVWEASLGTSVEKALRKVARKRLEMALRRTGRARHIDLVDDLAVPAAYGVIDELYGIPGPPWLTELAASLPFSRQHVAELPPDWIAAFKGEKPADPGLTSMQIWLAVSVAGLLGNRENQRPLQAVSRQAATEALTHIDTKLAEWRALGGSRTPQTLAEAFVQNEGNQTIINTYTRITPPGYDWRAVYYKDVAIILLEILGSTLTIVPLTFASVMTYLLDAYIDLPGLLRHLTQRKYVSQLIFEAERLNPNVPLRMRRCERETSLGKTIPAGRSVAALTAVANMDGTVFPQPWRFSLKDYGLPTGPPRNRDDYLLFGATGGTKYCWGQDRVALPLLQECIYAAGRLQGLRRVAGARGEPQKLVQVTIGLAARFDRILKARR